MGSGGDTMKLHRLAHVPSVVPYARISTLKRNYVEYAKTGLSSAPKSSTSGGQPSQLTGPQRS
eukprot:66083-Chlamydomonas_euryale.AAC.1